MPRPPFRADHVGSFLRPERLRAAREKFAAGALAAQDLHAIEDECIREVVRAELGLPTIELEIPPICDALLPTLGSRLQALMETARAHRES